MRNLKRALSLAMATFMLLGMMVVGAGAASVDGFSDKDKIVNTEAVNVLNTLGVIQGKPDGNYDPEGTVTRAEMAKMICVIMNGGKDPQLGEAVKNSYTDTVGHWASGYIEYCTTSGIIAGRNNGKFDPNGNVTVAEAGKMLLVALGYNASVEGYTGANWQINTDVRANAMRLYDDLKTPNTNVALTRDNAAQICYNALDQKIVEYTYVINGTADNSLTTKPQLNESKKGTLLYDKFGAVKVEGVVVANEFANLNSNKTDADKAPTSVVIGSSLDVGKTAIKVTNFDVQGKFSDAEHTFTTVTGENELGKSVYVYIKPGTTDLKSTVIGTAIVSDENKIVADATGDTAADVADDNNLDITTATQYAYNYASMSKTAPTKNGYAGVQKTLIDTDSDGKVDYILYKEMGLGKVTLYTEAKDGQIVVASNVNLTNKDKADVIGFADVAKDDYVLTAYLGGRLYVEKPETVTGKIDAYKQTEATKAPLTYRNTGFTIDGETYTVSRVNTFTGDLTAAVTEIDKTVLSSSATFYKDQNGYVIAYGEVDESAYKYAYVWGAEAGTTIGTDRVKVTLEDGTTKTYDLNSNSNIDIVKSGTGDGLKTVASDEMQGRIYTYSITSSGDIKLYWPKYGAAIEQQPIFTKGLTNIQFNGGDKVGAPVAGLTPVGVAPADTNKSTYYTGNATTFFYVTNKADGTVNDVIVYNGRNSAPSVNGVDAINKNSSAVLALRSKSGDVGAVVFNGVTVAESAGDHMFIYNANYVWDEYGMVDAFFNGKTEATKDVKVAIVDKDGEIIHNPTVANGIYLYKTTSKGYYELTRLSNQSYYRSGVVTRVNKANNTFVIGTNDINKSFLMEVELTANSIVVDYDSSHSGPIAYSKGSVNVGDTVEVIVNNGKDCDVLMAGIMARADTSTTPGVPTEMKTVLNTDNSIDVFNPNGIGTYSDVVNAAAAALTAKGYTDVTTVAGGSASAAVGGHYATLSAKSGILTQNFNVYNAARVDVNGTIVGYTHAGGTAVAVVSQTASAPMILTTVATYQTTTIELTTGADKKGNYTFTTGDSDAYGVVTLSDASYVTFSSATVGVALKSDATKLITDNNLVPVGTELVATAVTPAIDKAITATANTVATSGATTTASTEKATMGYTTTQYNVAFAVGTVAKDVAITLAFAAGGQADLTGSGNSRTYTTKSGAEQFTVKLSSANGSQGGAVTVTVAPTKGVSATTVFNLGATNASVSPASMSWTAGQHDERDFNITLSSNIAHVADTLTITDGTTAAYKLTVDNNAPVLKAVGATPAIAGTGTTYKAVANSVTTFAAYGNYTMPAFDAVITTGYVKITADTTAQTVAGVTSTATVSGAERDTANTANTFYALTNAGGVRVSYALGGTASGSPSSLTFNAANLTNFAISGKSANETFTVATGNVTVANGTTPTGTITANVTVAVMDVTVADPS